MNSTHTTARALRIALATAAFAILASPGFAGVIIKRDGKTLGEGAQGLEIREATWQEVKYRLAGTSRDQSVPADQVLRIIWDSEVSSSFKRAQGSLEDGKYEEAANRFKSLTNSMGRTKPNAQYFLGKVYQEWGRIDPSKYSEAATAYRDYLSANQSSKDFYVPHATLALADVLIAAAKYGEAETELKKLTGGSLGKTWVAGAKLGLADVKLAQEDFTGARQLFSELTSDANVLADEDFKGRAYLGYAKSQLGQKQYGPAVKTVKEKLLASSGQRPVRMDHYASQGFLVWGRAEEAEAGSDQKKLQWALIRYIRASAIAPRNSEDLAEALYRQREVLNKLGEQGRAEETRQRLLKECPDSPWAKK